MTAAATSSTPPPRSTMSMNRSCAPAARSTEAEWARSSRVAVDSSSSADRVSSSNRALSSAIAACAASEPSSETSERS